MKISDFKLIKNKQNIPSIYGYEKYNSGKTEKYSIATIDGGTSFIASVHSANVRGICVDTEFSKNCGSINDALYSIERYLLTCIK